MKIAAFIFILFVQLTASAAPPVRAAMCTAALDVQATLTPTMDPFEQWRTWEQQFNNAEFRNEKNLAVSYVLLPEEKFEVAFLPGATPELIAFIKQGSDIRWFRHPHHENLRWTGSPKPLPYLNLATNGTIEDFLHTASRSVVIPPREVANQYYTLKMATDHAHGPKGIVETDKATMKEDLLDSLERMKLIAQLDSIFGADSTFIISKEVAFVKDKTTGEGYSVRDRSYLQSGHRYLPVFALPYVGREIAQIHGAEAESFWEENYVKPLGRLKARLLLRYGIKMETPNAQNFLIELDQNYRPTGRLVVHDIGDSELVRSMLAGIGGEELWAREAKLGIVNTENFDPQGFNSISRFAEAKEKSYSKDTLNRWLAAHDRAFLEEISNLLKVDVAAIFVAKTEAYWSTRSSNPVITAYNIGYYTVDFLKDIMLSDLVQNKIVEYRQRLQQQHQQDLAAHTIH